MGRYRNWLPVPDDFHYPYEPVVYKAGNLGQKLGLDNLFVCFSGYWPEKGAAFRSCTFKELEAPPTYSRAIACGVKTIVVASAGNTARAFAHVGSSQDIDTILVIPDMYAKGFWLPATKGKRVKLFTVAGGADYADVIRVASRISALMGFTYEGGGRNVARREGLGLVAMAFYDRTNIVPHHYFQAVSSGAGAIGCFEFYQRLIEMGMETRLPKFHLVQNDPFVPMVNAWNAGRRHISPDDFPKGTNDRSCLSSLYANVLTNRHPWYETESGIYDILMASGGQMYGITEKEARRGGKTFEQVEGIDLVPAAEVCMGGLVRAVEQGNVNRTDRILINITGGGQKRYARDAGRHYPVPDAIIGSSEASDAELRGLFDE